MAKKSDKNKLIMGLLGVAAVGGVGYALWMASDKSEKKKAKESPCPPGQVSLGTDTAGNTMCGPEGLGGSVYEAEVVESPVILGSIFTPSKEQPQGGWAYRWGNVKTAAIESCRAKSGSIAGWSQFIDCVLKRAFPEATLSYAKSDWPAWISTAADQVRTDIKAILQDSGVSTQGWSFLLWLKFGRYIDGCYEALAPDAGAVAYCVASQIYPNDTWPPLPSLPETSWERQFWGALLDAVEAYDELQSEPSTGGILAQ